LNRQINAGVAERVGAYSDAVEVPTGSTLLYVSGTPGIDVDSGDLPDGFKEQADLAWRNILTILAEAKMGPENIVKITQHLTRREDLADYRAIRNQYLGDNRPASMLTFLSGLVWPNMLIELEVVASKQHEQFGNEQPAP